MSDPWNSEDDFADDVFCGDVSWVLSGVAIAFCHVVDFVVYCYLFYGSVDDQFVTGKVMEDDYGSIWVGCSVYVRDVQAFDQDEVTCVKRFCEGAGPTIIRHALR